MKNKTKIFLVICTIVVIVLTMCVSAFADVPTDYIMKYTIQYFDAQSYSSGDKLPYVDGYSSNNALTVVINVPNQGSYVIENVNVINGTEDINIGSDTQFPNARIYNDGSGDGAFISINYDELDVHSFGYLGAFTIEIYVQEGDVIDISPTTTPYANVTIEEYGGDRVVCGITGVFSNISGFVVSSLGMLQGVFYDGTNLTMLGTLALIGLAIGVAFLIVGVIQSFLRLKG